MMKKPDIEVADIFCIHGDRYRSSHNMSLWQHKTMNAIQLCRTAALGANNQTVCDCCGSVEISYNSCRNRHCPKCQFLRTLKWVNTRLNDLLPVQYFHVVFTLPDLLEPIILMNQKIMYNLLFQCVSETLIELGKDPKHLGAEVGFIGVLHTWDQKILDHTHLHCIVPGGGLSLDQTKWIYCKKDYLIPVQVLSDLFKKKFLYYLKKLMQENKLKYGRGIGQPTQLLKIISKLYKRGWVVYSKPSFNGPASVINYLGKYTHRIAISNYRILELKDDKVTFSWKDRANNNKQKKMTVAAREFIRRFLLHVLPPGYIKIRHFGILSNKNKKTKLKLARELLGITEPQPAVLESQIQAIDYIGFILEKTGIDITTCPICGIGKRVTQPAICWPFVPP